MTKQDTVGVTLRKLDFIWNKKGMTFCESVKQLLGGGFEVIDDDEVLQRIKDIDIDDKSK